MFVLLCRLLSRALGDIPRRSLGLFPGHTLLCGVTGKSGTPATKQRYFTLARRECFCSVTEATPYAYILNTLCTCLFFVAAIPGSGP